MKAPYKTTLLIDLDGTLLGSYSALLRPSFIGAYGTYFLKTCRNPWPYLLALKKVQQEVESGLAAKLGTNIKEAAIAVFAQETRQPLSNSEDDLLGAVRFALKAMRYCFYQMPDALDFLEWARGHYQLILATNPFWPPDIIHNRLRWGKIDSGLFKFITHSENMTFSKPHPSYYSEILKKRGLSAGECLMIGNDVRKDTPAFSIGIETYILGSFEGVKRQLRQSIRTPKMKPEAEQENAQLA